ncbi:MAG: MarR family winged helix-turn-helix transcriptional regulator [Luteibaculaceae bacterium]
MKPEQTIDFHIRWAWYNISRMYNQAAADFGVSMSVGYVLLNIDKEGTPSTKLGPKMGMEPKSLSRTLKNMEKLGLIERKADKTDKRLAKVFLTPFGKEKRNLARQEVLKFNLNLREALGERDAELFIELLQKVNGEIKNNNIGELHLEENAVNK